MIKVAGILLCEVSVLFLTSYTQAKEYKKPEYSFYNDRSTKGTIC